MKARINYNDKCSVCERKYKDHNQDEITECVQDSYEQYDGELDSLLAILSKENLSKKWGQPGQLKSEWAMWPTDGSSALVSSIPTRDFAIYFLSSKAEKPKPKPKVEEKDNGKKEEAKHFYPKE